MIKLSFLVSCWLTNPAFSWRFYSKPFSWSAQQSRAQIQKTVRELELLSFGAGRQAPKSMDEAFKKRYQFWETQPVPRLSRSKFNVHTDLCIDFSCRIPCIGKVSMKDVLDEESWDTGHLSCSQCPKLSRLYILNRRALTCAFSALDNIHTARVFERIKYMYRRVFLDEVVGSKKWIGMEKLTMLEYFLSLVSLKWLLFVGEKVSGNEPIEQDKPTEAIRQETYSLPPGFGWDTLDIRDPLIVSLSYNLSVWAHLWIKLRLFWQLGKNIFIWIKLLEVLEVSNIRCETSHCTSVLCREICFGTTSRRPLYFLLQGSILNH